MNTCWIITCNDTYDRYRVKEVEKRPDLIHCSDTEEEAMHKLGEMLRKKLRRLAIQVAWLEDKLEEEIVES